jgi:hypothetical protein
MLATLMIEFALAFYVVFRYKMTSATRLITALLVGLATFQLAEYYVCTNSIGFTEQWSRLGFASITLLPPLGLHLMHVLAGKPNRRLVQTAYLTMAGFVVFFLTAQNTFAGHQCTGNYVIFQFSENVTGVYSIYYFGWIAAALGLGWKWANEIRPTGKAALKRLQTVQALILGYLVFLVPTAAANVINPATRAGIPSVMCGFAVLLSLILGFYILPRIGKVQVVKKLKT